MSDDMSEWPSCSIVNSLVNMNQLGAAQTSAGIRKTNQNQVNGFDPYQMMVNRRKRAVGADSCEESLPAAVQYPDNDIKELESFCQEHGIVGFNCGRMHPKAALGMLKSKIGVKDDFQRGQTRGILKG